VIPGISNGAQERGPPNEPHTTDRRKVLTEAALFVVSFAVQQCLRGKARRARGDFGARVIHHVDAEGILLASFALTKPAASLVFSSDAVTDGATYTVYVSEGGSEAAGLVEGSLDGAEEAGTVVAGEYTQG
jgi:hypothetical protein